MCFPADFSCILAELEPLKGDRCKLDAIAKTWSGARREQTIRTEVSRSSYFKNRSVNGLLKTNFMFSTVRRRVFS